jgi:hypothetical protein
MAFRELILIVSRHPPSATAPIAALAPFRRKISESAHQQAAAERNRKIRENRREKEKNETFESGLRAAALLLAGIGRIENGDAPQLPSPIRPSRLSGPLSIPSVPDLPHAAPRSEKPSKEAIEAVAVAHLLVGAPCPSARWPFVSTASVTQLAGLSLPPCDRF